MTFVCFQSNPFNITTIQVYVLTTDAETDHFYEDLQHFLELTHKNDVLFITGDWNAKAGSQEIPEITGKFGLIVQNEAGQRLPQFCQENTVIISKHPLSLAAGEGDEDIIEVDVAVTVLILEDAGEIAQNLGQQADDSRSRDGTKIEVLGGVVGEDLADERGDRARAGRSLARQEALDKLEAARLGRRLGQTAEDGLGQAADDLVGHVGRDIDIADRTLDRIEDKVLN